MKTETQKKLLSIQNLHIAFKLSEGTVRAVRGVNLDVFQNEVLGIVGESGCGKSVTAQSILRIIDEPGKITDGKVLYYDTDGSVTDIAQLNPKGKTIQELRGRKISMIFQEPMSSFSPVYTIGKQIAEAVRTQRDISKKEARSIVIELLSKVGISNPEMRIDEYPFEFSGGMRQRAMIAMALVSNPTLLIADEPTTALDVTIQAQILSLMKDIKKEINSSIIFITHSLGVIAQMADRIAIMYLGQVVELGTVTQIFDEPLHPYTQDLLQAIPKIGGSRGKLASIKGSVPDPYSQVIGCPYHERCSKMIPGLCDVKEPQVKESDSAHQVVCWLYQ